MSSPHRSQLDPTLEEILKLWTDFNASLDPEEVYSKACKAAVELTGSDRSKFVRFDGDFTYGTVCNEYVREGLSDYPYWRPAQNRRIRIQGVPEEQPLFEGKIVQHEDVRILPPGVFKDNLTDLGIKSILIVPVRWKDSMLGSFSIEGVERERSFNSRDVQLCRLIADAVAQALENSRIYKRECYRRELLGRLDASRTQLMGARDELELRKRVRDLAQQLCGWKTSALFRYVEPTNALQFVPNQLSADTPADPGSVSLEDSTHWLVGELRDPTERRPAILRRKERAQVFARDNLLAPFQQAAVLRINRFGKLDSAVVLLDDSAERDFEDTELEYLTEFTARAVTAIEREEGWNAVEQKLVRLMLPLLGPTPVTESDLQRTLYRFLTIVTAGFGLRFNRAAVLLLNENRDALVPRFGVGQFEQREWKERCDADAKEDANKLDQWLSGAYDEPYSTPLEIWARHEPAFSLSDPEAAVFAPNSAGIGSDLLASAEERESLPPRFRERWNSASPVVLVRLHDDTDSIGLLVADNEFTRRPVNEDLAILQVFCRLAAQTIASYAHQQRVEKINALFKRMSDIKTEEKFSSLTPMEVLQRIVDEVERAFEAPAAGILTIDEHGAAKIQHASRLEWFSPVEVLAWKDVWTQVDKAPLSKLAEDEEIHPALRARGIHSIVYLPLSQHGRCVGTLVVFPARPSDARRFGATTIQRYADEASQVYNSWFTLHFLRDLDAAVQGMVEEVSRGSTVDGSR